MNEELNLEYTYDLSGLARHLERELAAAQAEIKMLRGKCAAIEGDEIGNPCVALSDAIAQRDTARNDAMELAAVVCENEKLEKVFSSEDEEYNLAVSHCAAAIRAMKECVK